MSLQAAVYALIWISLSLWAASHAALYKRDSRSLVGWVGIIWLAPIVGAGLYLMFGINRIQRRAHAILQQVPKISPVTHGEVDEACLTHLVVAHLRPLVRLGDQVTKRHLVSGNHVAPLINGDEAYPQMLEAIASAEQSVSLCTYIFDGDHAGQLFLHALQAALNRGVEVRVLVDDVGARYSWPTAVSKARKLGIPVAKFLPVLVPWLFYYSNLRNHRKILVIDGRIGFTGGLNIRAEHLLSRATRHSIRDVHFRLEGPVVTHLQESFAQDWICTTGEYLGGEIWFPALAPSGTTVARGIVDGPDVDCDNLRMVLLGAIAAAQSTITIVTPYFLPDAAIIAALNVAAASGVEVHIVIPERTNLALVQWASTAQLWQVLERGCRVWLSGCPFDHSKLMIVDNQWSLIGSMNWDPRSLRLNFEFNVECYDERLAATLQQIVAAKIATSREVSLKDLDSRGWGTKLRDGFSRVLMPYL